MSEVLDDFLKSTYEDLFPLDAAQKVWAIRHTGSSDICVRKEVAAESCAIARRAMNITNIHIVNIRHIIDDGDRHYIVEDYIHGSTLQELHDGGRRFGESEAVSYMLQLLDGLSALHGAGIVHRDISPKNVLSESRTLRTRREARIHRFLGRLVLRLRSSLAFSGRLRRRTSIRPAPF